MDVFFHIASLWRFWAALGLVGLAAVLFYAFAPPQHNPLRPLNLDDPVGLATYGKFTDLKHDPDACYAALDAVSVDYTKLPNKQTGVNCGFQDAVSVSQLAAPLNDRLSLTCALTAALYTWERHTVRPLAEDMLGTTVTRIETYGSYACRNIAGTRQRSEHASANAIDIAGFRLADGRLVSVKKYWDTDTLEGQYLDRLHAEACRLFSVTLGPDYNAAHHDHFHLDFGSGDTCK